MSKSTLYLGCISGTSVDGLDIALVEIDEQESISIVAAETVPIPADLRQQLLLLGQPQDDDLDMFGACDRDLGIFIAQQFLAFLAHRDIDPAQITAIGSHGQTVRHSPPSQSQPYGYSIQIGDPGHIAEITNIQTVADFRRRDLAAGGHGAPLVPPFHAALFGQIEGDVAVLNIGGISNLSLLGEVPRGFDSGPGNALMDSWYAQHKQGSFDTNGQWAKSGQIDEALLHKCMADPYFELAPPKSTGREYFNLAWLQQQLAGSNCTSADIQATLSEVTAQCTADALQQWAPSTTHLIVCGGGRLNGHLMSRLAHHCEAFVSSSEAWQIDGDSVESALFAWLAHRTLNALPGNEPQVTGAAGYRILGVVHPA